MYQTVSESKQISKGIITLIYKKVTKDHWRIDELSVLRNITFDEQTCCIAGLDIVDKSTSLWRVIDFTGYDNFTRNENAFVACVWYEYMINVLKAFSFWDDFINWVIILYTHTRTHARSHAHSALHWVFNSII